MNEEIYFDIDDDREVIHTQRNTEIFNKLVKQHSMDWVFKKYHKQYSEYINATLFDPRQDNIFFSSPEAAKAAAKAGSELNLLDNNYKGAKKLSAKPKHKLAKGKLIALNPENEFVGNALSMKAEREGLKVDFSTNPKDLLKNIKENKPDLVITGLIMPEFSGIDLVKKIRKSKEFHSLPIIMMSNIFLPSIIEEAFAAGVYLYIDQHQYTPSQVVNIYINSLLEIEEGKK